VEIFPMDGLFNWEYVSKWDPRTVGICWHDPKGRDLLNIDCGRLLVVSSRLRNFLTALVPEATSFLPIRLQDCEGQLLTEDFRVLILRQMATSTNTVVFGTSPCIVRAHGWAVPMGGCLVNGAMGHALMTAKFRGLRIDPLEAR
jgi:hypothetical protein